MVEGAKVDNQLLVVSQRPPMPLTGCDLILRASLVISLLPLAHQLWQQAANRGLSVQLFGGLRSLLRPTSGPFHILRPGWLVVQSCTGRLPKAPWGVAVSPVLAYWPVAIKRVSVHHGDPHVSWMLLEAVVFLLVFFCQKVTLRVFLLKPDGMFSLSTGEGVGREQLKKKVNFSKSSTYLRGESRRNSRSGAHSAARELGIKISSWNG